MSSTSILKALQQQLTPQTIEAMGGQLGTDTRTTSNAITLALPVLLGALSKNVSTPQGADALDQALGAHDGTILNDLGGNLNGLFGGGSALGGIGGAILGHILGSRRPPVEEGVGRATGLNAQQVSQLLVMLAPIVMGVLGRMKHQQGVGPKELPDVLNQSASEIQTKAPETAGLGSVLDNNHDGQITDDIARIGKSILGGLFTQNA